MATRGWQHVTESELAQRLAGLTRLAQQINQKKYKNLRVEVDGQKFDSKAEADQWLILKARERAGEIHGLLRQVHFALYTATADREMRVRVSAYIADFVYVDGDGTKHVGARHVVDVKRRQTKTQVYALKRKWLYLQDGIVIEEVG